MDTGRHSPARSARSGASDSEYYSEGDFGTPDSELSDELDQTLYGKSGVSVCKDAKVKLAMWAQSYRGVGRGNFNGPGGVACRPLVWWISSRLCCSCPGFLLCSRWCTVTPKSEAGSVLLRDRLASLSPEELEFERAATASMRLLWENCMSNSGWAFQKDKVRLMRVCTWCKGRQ